MTLTNRDCHSLLVTHLTLRLPRGFRYVPGSATLNADTPIDDPRIMAGGTLVRFDDRTLILPAGVAPVRVRVLVMTPEATGGYVLHARATVAGGQTRRTKVFVDVRP